MADCTPATHSSPTAARSPTRRRPPAHRSGLGVSSDIGAGDGVGVAVGIDSAMSGVGAEMTEQPASRMTAVHAKATDRVGEPAWSEGAWNGKVTGAVPHEDGVIHARSVSVSWVRGMSRIYHTRGYGLSAVGFWLSSDLRPPSCCLRPAAPWGYTQPVADRTRP